MSTSMIFRILQFSAQYGILIIGKIEPITDILMQNGNMVAIQYIVYIVYIKPARYNLSKRQ